MLKFTSTLAAFIVAITAANSQILATDIDTEETVLTLNLGNMITLASLTKVGTYL